jgi:hypothetical protein
LGKGEFFFGNLMSLWKIAMNDIRDPVQLRYVRDSEWPPNGTTVGAHSYKFIHVSISVAS